MNKKVYLLIQSINKKGEIVICVSEDIGVCIRRVKTLDPESSDTFDITHRPGVIYISNVIKNIHCRIISRELRDMTGNTLYVLSKMYEIDGDETERIHYVFESMEKAVNNIKSISKDFSCVSKGIDKWTYNVRHNNPVFGQTGKWMIRKYIIK